MAIDEQIVFFQSGDTSLAGILTAPASPRGIAVIIAWGGGAYPSSGRNRIRARLARSLAEQGFHAFRFDYAGVGESGGEFREATLGSPYDGDIVAVADWLATQGFNRIIVVGNCFGGWSALLAAPAIRGLEGIAVVNPPVDKDHRQAIAADKPASWWLRRIGRFRLSKLRSAESRARYRRMIGAKASSVSGLGSRENRFSKAARWVVQHDVPLLLIYGPDGFRQDFDRVYHGGLDKELAKTGPTTRLVLVEDRLTGYANLQSQETFLQISSEWINDVAGPPPINA